jgi:SOS-response transcriptional repressor LexA
MTLTKIDQETLGFVQTFVRDMGRFPTNRETGAALNLMSTGTVKYRLDRLVRARVVDRVGSASKGHYSVVAQAGCCAGCGQALPLVAAQ